ncbi:MAG: NAD-dependent epimerase/dehydratase family protein [bacterium]|nr:NAD-dependent epimerase/dehydratase family protein [bacterium]
MTVLITGGAGFIGGHLCQRLAERGFAVHLADNFARGTRDDFLQALLATGRVELFECDLSAEDALGPLGDGYTHVYHFAAILGVQNVLERPFATLSTNVKLLESALAFCRRQSKLERLVFASTSEVYAGSLEHFELPIPTPENVPLALPALDHPRTSYMLSKLYGEAMVQQSGLPFTIVRPHNIYGPRMGMSHVVPQLLEKAHHLQAGDKLEVFSVDHRRTFCYIDDAIEMIARVAAEAGCEGEVLNIGNQQPEIAIGELAQVVLEAVGRDAAIDPRPATPGSPTRRCPDVSRLAQRTGYRGVVSLEEGVARTYEWYRKRVFDTTPGEEAR